MVRKPLTYADLPTQDRSRRLIPPRGKRTAFTIEGRPVLLQCPRCLNTFSATRGDYFTRKPNEVVRHCGREMRLIQEGACAIEVLTPEQARRAVGDGS